MLVGYESGVQYCQDVPDVDSDCAAAPGECGIVYNAYPGGFCIMGLFKESDYANVATLEVLDKQSVAGDCSVSTEKSTREQLDHTWYLVSVTSVIRGKLPAGNHWIFTTGASGLVGDGPFKGPGPLVNLEVGETVTAIVHRLDETTSKGPTGWIITTDGQVFRSTPEGHLKFGEGFSYTGSGIVPGGVSTILQFFAELDAGEPHCGSLGAPYEPPADEGEDEDFDYNGGPP
jgi:hypothetical protein